MMDSYRKRVLLGRAFYAFTVIGFLACLLTIWSSAATAQTTQPRAPEKSEPLKPPTKSEQKGADKLVDRDEMPDFIWINDELWSIETLNFARKILAGKTNSPVAAAFKAPHAPLFFNPITKKWASNLAVAASMGENRKLIYGRVFQRTKGGILVMDNKDTLRFVKCDNKLYVDDDYDYFAIKIDGVYTYTTVMGAEKNVESGDGNIEVRYATNDEAKRYLADNKISGMPLVRPRPVSPISSTQFRQGFTGPMKSSGERRYPEMPPSCICRQQAPDQVFDWYLTPIGWNR